MVAGCCASGALLSEPMRRRRGLESRPSRYVAPGGYWPTGKLKALTNEQKLADEANDVLDVVNFVKALALRIEQKCDEQTIYKVAKDANVNAQTVANFLHGRTWGDVVVIYRLERGLKEALWNHDHVQAALRQKGRPRDHLIDARQWPRGILVYDAPDAVDFVQQLAERLDDLLYSDDLLSEESLQAVAEDAGVHEKEILDLLRGDTWGDAELIFRLEQALDQKLWSHDHLSPR